MSDLDDIMKKLNHDFGANTIISGDEIIAMEIERIPTGSLALDIETGGGYPCGRVIELFGRESAGKSFMALKAVAEAQKLGKVAVWIDVEGSFDPVWAALLGVNLKKLKLSRPETGELACDVMDAVIRSGECGILVLDSTAALVPLQDIETAMNHVEQMGIRAKMVNRLVRKLHSALNMKVGEDCLPNSCLVIFVNQIREKIGVAFGNPETTPGGLGLRHAASIRISFSKAWIKASAAEDEKRIIGQTVKFITVKNKTFPPYRRGEFAIYVDGPNKGQLDDTGEIFTYGLLTGFIVQEKSTYLIGKDKIGVGKPDAMKYLKDNSKVAAELRQKIITQFLKKKVL